VANFGEEESGPAAEEGTIAHGIGADFLMSRNPTRAIRSATIDADLKIALQVYVDTVEDFLDEYHKKGLNPKLYVEQRIGATDNLNGTADCLIVHDDGFVVIDYKHGQRVYVEADAEQLRTYGYLGFQFAEVAKRKEQKWSADATVTLCVVQPRFIGDALPVRWETFPANQFLAEELKKVTRALDGAKGQTDQFNPGDHCLFCYAKAFCPAKVELIQEVLEAAKDMKNVDKLKFILENESELKSILKKARGAALSGLERGSIKPEEIGFGLKKSLGNRMWSHAGGESKLAPLLRKHGVDKEIVWVKKLISPAQASKLVDDKKWLENYVVREDRGVTLAPLDKADPELTGSVGKELQQFEVPTEEKTETTDFSEEDF
jgi:hypothetical protein